MPQNSYIKQQQKKFCILANTKYLLLKRWLMPDSQYMYWVTKEGENKIINKRFLTQELFALKNQFV